LKAVGDSFNVLEANTRKPRRKGWVSEGLPGSTRAWYVWREALRTREALTVPDSREGATETQARDTDI